MEDLYTKQPKPVCGRLFKILHNLRLYFTYPTASWVNVILTRSSDPKNCRLFPRILFNCHIVFVRKNRRCCPLSQRRISIKTPSCLPRVLNTRFFLFTDYNGVIIFRLLTTLLSVLLNRHLKPQPGFQKPCPYHEHPGTRSARGVAYDSSGNHTSSPFRYSMNSTTVSSPYS